MATIVEDYVSFETAKLLKEKGFDEESYKFYRHVFYNNKISFEDCRFSNEDGTLEFGSDTMTNKTIDVDFWSGTQEAIIAPTLQMAMKWLREVYNIHIEIKLSEKGYWFLCFNILTLEVLENSTFNLTYGRTYEESCEFAIKYCLENLI